MTQRPATAIIDDLISGLRDLQTAIAPTAEPARPREERTPTPPATSRARRPLSKGRRRDLVLHGQYLGAIRPLSVPARAKVKAVQQSKGYEAAIRLAKRLRA